VPGSSQSQTSTDSFIIDAYEGARLARTNYWTFRDWLLTGVIPRIIYPAPQKRRKGGRAQRTTAHKKMRRLLCDRRDVEKFLEACKTASRVILLILLVLVEMTGPK
jgi:hypothetical protein